MNSTAWCLGSLHSVSELLKGLIAVLEAPLWFAVSAITCLPASGLLPFCSSCSCTKWLYHYWGASVRWPAAPNNMALFSATAIANHVQFYFKMSREDVSDEGNSMATIKCRYRAEGGIIESGMCTVRDFPSWFRGWSDSRLLQYRYLWTWVKMP